MFSHSSLILSRLLLTKIIIDRDDSTSGPELIKEGCLFEMELFARDAPLISC